ncbi:MAG: hypothetical protein RI560_12515 [Natronomonas sp.]|nr:hypothetical protein [Natronomonas sp.]
MHITDTDFWHDVMHGVYGPRQGGARIIVDAEGASTGVGKTGLAVYFAKLCAKAFGYELQHDDVTLSGDEYLRRWREHPGPEQPSVIILDELSGAGAGDARRSMSNKNVNLGRSWQLMRKKRIVTITTLPHWSDADKRMRRFCDYRLYCLEQPIGYFRPYRVKTSFGEGHVRTKKYDDVQRVRFPNMDANEDELYGYATTLKDELLASEVFDADELTDGEEDEPLDPEEAERGQKVADAQRARDRGLSTREVASIVDMSQSWVQKYTDPTSDATGGAPPADD